MISKTDKMSKLFFEEEISSVSNLDLKGNRLLTRTLHFYLNYVMLIILYYIILKEFITTYHFYIFFGHSKLKTQFQIEIGATKVTN